MESDRTRRRYLSLSLSLSEKPGVLSLREKPGVPSPPPLAAATTEEGEMNVSTAAADTLRRDILCNILWLQHINQSFVDK